jgi:hypothetical protein
MSTPEQLNLTEKIDRVEKIKDEILRHSTILSGTLQQLKLDEWEDPPEIVNIAVREIRTILKELTKLEGFCDRKTSKIIENYVKWGVLYTSNLGDFPFAIQKSSIEFWATRIQDVPLDYNTNPFAMKAGVEVKIPNIKGTFETFYQRQGFPQGWVWYLLVLFIGIVIGWILKH